jgi:hypothetical protein
VLVVTHTKCAGNCTLIGMAGLCAPCIHPVHPVGDWHKKGGGAHRLVAHESTAHVAVSQLCALHVAVFCKTCFISGSTIGTV